MKSRIKLISAILCSIFMLGYIFSPCGFVIKANANEEVRPSETFDSIVNEDYGEEIGDYLYLNSEQKMFLPNESIMVSYSVFSGENIVDFNYSQNGFNVISINIDEYDESRIIIELGCVPDVTEAAFDISVTLENGENTSALLYAFSNEYGSFISTSSVDNAMERYCWYAVQNNILTEDQARNLFLERYRMSLEESSSSSSNISIMESTANTMSTETAVVNYRGILSWSDDNGNIHPLRDVQVEIYSKIDDILFLLNSTNTDLWGYYDFDVRVGTYIVLKVYAGDSNAMVKSGILLFDYYSEIDLGFIDESNTGVITHDPFTMSNDFGKALQISQAVLTARDYAMVMRGEIPSNVAIVYPYDGEIEETHNPNNTNNCFYNYILKTINITGKHPREDDSPHSYASWDVIMHEYGHHIQHQIEIIDSPGGSHYIDENNADERGSKYDGTGLAWGESWSTVFGLMAQQYYSSFLTNISTVGDSAYTSYNGLNYDIENSTDRLGDACEGSIMAVLWDLYDNDNEVRDTISLGHQAFWDVTTGNQSKTFSDFINYFYAEYPEYIDDLGPNLTYYCMASSTAIMVDSSIISQTVPPTFVWNGQGGSERYFNNSFSLIFYDDLGNEILRTPTVNCNGYILTQSEWNSIIYSDIDSFTVAVASMQTDYPSTGPYISERSVPYLKSDIHMHSDNYVDYVKTSDTHHTAICECGYEENQQHFNYRYGNSIVDTSTHRIYCICGHMIKTEEHIFRLIAGRNICTLCGYEKQGGLEIMGKKEEEEIY